MKSRLLTCALLVLGLSCDYSQAKSSVSVSGQLLETALCAHQKKKFNKERGNMLLTMGSISFEAALYDVLRRVRYSAYVDLSGDMSTVKQQNPVLNAAYLSASCRAGTIKMGNAFSAATELMIDGTQLLGGDGGFSGTSTFSAFNPAAYAIIMTGCYYDPGYATQFTYMTPSLKGLQLGVTYIPNSLHVGLLPENDSFNSMSYGMTAHADESLEAAQIKNLATKDLMAYGNGGFISSAFAGGIRYDGGVPHHWNFSVAATFWAGKANLEKKFKKQTADELKMHNLQALSVGFTLGYKHIKIGFGYVNQFKSCLPKKRSGITKEFLEAISDKCWDGIVGETEFDTNLVSNDNLKNAFAALPEEDRKDLTSDNSGNFAQLKTDGFNTKLTELTGFGEKANAGQIFTGVISYLPGSKSKIALGGIYALRKMGPKEKTKTFGGSITVDYRVTQGVGLFAGVTYLKTKTCRRAILIAMSEAKSSAPFADNHIIFVSAGLKMNF